MTENLPDEFLGTSFAGKTRIVCSHSPSCAAAADMLLRLRHGRQVYFGRPENDPEQRPLLGENPNGRRSLNPDPTDKPEASDRNLGVANGMEDEASFFPGVAPDGLKGVSEVRGDEEAGGGVLEAGRVGGEGGEGAEDGVRGAEEESRVVGHVRLGVWVAYGRATGVFMSAIILISLVLMQVILLSFGMFINGRLVCLCEVYPVD